MEMWGPAPPGIEGKFGIWAPIRAKLEARAFSPPGLAWPRLLVVSCYLRLCGISPPRITNNGPARHVQAHQSYQCPGFADDSRQPVSVIQSNDVGLWTELSHLAVQDVLLLLSPLVS